VSSKRIIVIGAGIAGASAAWHLAKGGAKVLIIEKEDAPDRHSTGRNAAILRTALDDPLLHALARESLAFYRTPPEGFSDTALFEPCGLFIAATPEASSYLREWSSNPDCVVDAHQTDADALSAAIPALAPGLDAVVSLPKEGVFDIAAIHQGFLRGAQQAGAELRLNCSASELVCAGNLIHGVRLDSGSVLEAEDVVLANGAWAGKFAGNSGCDLPLTPKRRHLLVTEPLASVDPTWPVVWICGEDYYFRPESGGLMISACDQTEVDPDDGEISDQSVLADIARKTAKWLPDLADAGAAFFWAGIRTFAPDDRFVIGPDPRMKGLHWLAGLGGHGITCAPACGRILADAILYQPDAVPEGLQAARLLAKPSSC
jgi:D-arginine dehydrogenase